MPRRLVVAAGLAWVPALRLLSWALLFVSVWVTILGFPIEAELRIQAGAWPRWLHLVPAALFAAFTLAFGIYRFVLLRRGRYNPAKGFLQVGLSVLVLTWVGAASLGRYRAAPVKGPAVVSLGPLLQARDPAVRAVACEAVQSRSEQGLARERARRLATEDPDPRVRDACARVR